MSFEMTRNLAFMFRTTDGGTVIAAQKESFSAGLETEYWSRIGREAWGDNKVDNNAGGDNKVDNKVDNNARGGINVDIKVDNNVWDDTVNRPRTRTTTPYNTRTRPVQHPYKKRWCRLGEVMRGGVVKHGSLTNSLKEKVRETFVAAQCGRASVP